MKRQFSAKLSTFRERVIFYDLRQKEGESVRDWYMRIKRQASNCRFGAILEHILKDKFVTGMSEGPVKGRLCEKEPGDKSLVELFELALKRESLRPEKKTVSEVLSIKKGSSVTQRPRKPAEDDRDREQRRPAEDDREAKNRKPAEGDREARRRPRCTVCGSSEQ